MDALEVGEGVEVVPLRAAAVAADSVTVPIRIGLVPAGALDRLAAAPGAPPATGGEIRLFLLGG